MKKLVAILFAVAVLFTLCAGNAEGAALEDAPFPITMGEAFSVEGLFDFMVGDVSTYDEDIFEGFAENGMQWLGVSVYLYNGGDAALSIFPHYIFDVMLIHGEETYAPTFTEANPVGTDYTDTLSPIAPKTEIEAFMKFQIPTTVSRSDSLTLQFVVCGTTCCCDLTEGE